MFFEKTKKKYFEDEFVYIGLISNEDININISYFFGAKPKDIEEHRFVIRRGTENHIQKMNDENLKERISI